jgi:nucleoside-diphosphate-sugar epimerase
MKIAIVGANSFLAQYIIKELLLNKDEVYLWGTNKPEININLPFSYFVYPKEMIDLSELISYDIIIYTAGAGIQASLKESIDLIFALNCFVPINIINYLIENSYKGKFISFGSYFEIGEEKNKKYYNEFEVSLAKNPIYNDYSCSKRLFTRYISSNPRLINLYHFILPNIYGKGENKNRLIPYIIDSLYSNSQVKVTSGNQVRQYLHALDIAKTVVDVINNDYPCGIYNLTNMKPLVIKDVIKTVIEVMGRNYDPDEVSWGNSNRKDTAMPYLLLENGIAQNTFRYQPTINLEEGIKLYL